MHDELNIAVAERIAHLDIDKIKHDFARQDEFVFVEDFLPHAQLDAFVASLPSLDPLVHRNFIPKHKKGGSVSRFDLDRNAPHYAQLYEAEALVAFLSELTERDLNFCPHSDPHTYALYYYTEAGDHIGYHYDTSYYAGARYTVLLGLVSAPSCRLEYRLFTKDPTHEVETLDIELKPGTLVLFNGDKLHHRITPLSAGERRVALTLEYVTDAHMHPVLRFVSNMKDAIAYFGFKQVFKRLKRTPK